MFCFKDFCLKASFFHNQLKNIVKTIPCSKMVKCPKFSSFTSLCSRKLSQKLLLSCAYLVLFLASLLEMVNFLTRNEFFCCIFACILCISSLVCSLQCLSLGTDVKLFKYALSVNFYLHLTFVTAVVCMRNSSWPFLVDLYVIELHTFGMIMLHVGFPVLIFSFEQHFPIKFDEKP